MSTLALILSSSNYFRYIFRRRNEPFFISNTIEAFVKQLRKEKGMNWTILKNTYIWHKQLVHRYVKNNINFKKSNFTMNGAPVKVVFFVSLYFHHTKNQPSLRSVQPFLNIDHNFGNICFLKSYNFLLGSKIWVITMWKSANILV